VTIKASLKIILTANDIEIAESDNPKLWQEVFATISQGVSAQRTRVEPEKNTITTSKRPETELSVENVSTKKDPIGSFAKEISISRDELLGAIGPTMDEPYIHLDPHCWEALRKNTGTRGKSSIAPTSLAATVLALWFKHAGISEHPTTKLCSAVLNTIHLTDKNAPRAIRNTEWLQSRGNGIVINPAQRSRAIALTASFCTKSPVNQA